MLPEELELKTSQLWATVCMNRDVMQLGKEMFLNHPSWNLYIPSSQAQLQAILKTEQ